MALRAVVPRADVDVAAALAAVAPICEDVRARGVPALLELTERFDGVHAEDVRVPAHALTDALAALDPPTSAPGSRSRSGGPASWPPTSCAAPRRRRSSPVAGVRAVGARRARGLYVPGGRAVYPPSVVMNVVPAQSPASARSP